MTEALVLSEDVTNFVCEVLVHYVQNPERLNANADRGHILKRKGTVYATAKGVKAAWNLYLDKTRILPETRPISDALKIMSKKQVVTRPWLDAKSVRYFVLRLSYLKKWAREYGGLTDSELEEFINTPEQDTNYGPASVTRIHGDGMDPTGEEY